MVDKHRRSSSGVGAVIVAVIVAVVVVGLGLTIALSLAFGQSGQTASTPYREKALLTKDKEYAERESTKMHYSVDVLVATDDDMVLTPGAEIAYDVRVKNASDYLRMYHPKITIRVPVVDYFGDACENGVNTGVSWQAENIPMLMIDNIEDGWRCSGVDTGQEGCMSFTYNYAHTLEAGETSPPLTKSLKVSDVLPSVDIPTRNTIEATGFGSFSE